MKLVAEPSGIPRSGFAGPRAGNACQIEKAVADSGLIQAAALFQNIGRSIALVHKAQGFGVAGFDADGQAVVAGLTEGG